MVRLLVFLMLTDASLEPIAVLGQCQLSVGACLGVRQADRRGKRAPIWLE